MTFENYNDFAKTFDAALEGKRSAQGAIRDAILESARGTEVKEAISSDMLTRWVNKVVAPTFEREYDLLKPTWTKFATEEKLNDFRPTQLVALEPDFDATLLKSNGGFTAPAETLPLVPELTPYPTFGYKASGKWVDTAKHGARIHFSWEAFINDDWSLIERFPQDAAHLARRTVDAAVYGLLWSLDPAVPGFNPFNINDQAGTVLKARSADGLQIIKDVPKNSPLSFDALQAAIQQVRESTVNGRPVMVPRFVLLVPPALKATADLLINSQQIERQVTTPDGAVKFSGTNGLAASIEVVESDFPALLGGPNAGTNWVLAPAGGRTSARRTLVRTTLRGYDKPELRVSNNTGSYLGGGSVKYSEGSFDNDDAQARVRLITGGGALNLDGIVASTGKGV